MYIRDYLHDIPLRTLKTIARALDVAVVYEARIKLINAIDRAFWDGTLVQQLLKRLTPAHHCLLALVSFSYDAGVDEKRLMKKAERLLGLSRRVIQRHLDDLMVYSLVGCIRENGNRYFSPHGVVEQVRSSFLQGVRTPAGIPRSVPNASSPNLLEDIFSLLAFINKSDTSLTLTGNIKKSALERALSGSQTPTGADGPFNEETHNSFIVEYLKTRELVVFEHRLARTTELLSGWLDLSMTERYQDIAAFTLAYLLQDAYTIIAISGILAETEVGAGFSPGPLAAFLHDYTMTSGGRSRLEARIRTFLHVLSHLGLLSRRDEEYIITPTGERFFRNESLPIDESISGDFTIQPNFEMIIGPEIDPRVRFQLEMMSERKNRDMVLTYTVTREGIGRAREHGMSVEEVLTFFRDHARNDVPQNVLFSIESWAQEYGSIFFEESLLMRFHDPAVCDSVTHMPELTPYIREQVSDTVLVVSPEHTGTIARVVKKAGFQPEVFGTTIRDNARSGAKFISATITKILEPYRMPDFYSEFLFPENAIEEKSTS